MGCSSCKKKETFENRYKEATSYIGKTTTVFFVIWTLFALYGVYSLITKFI